MDMGYVVLGVVAVAAGGGVVWLLIGRGGLQARVAAAEARAGAAEGRVTVAEAERAGEKEAARVASARADELAMRNQACGVRIATLEEEANSAAKVHAGELQRMQEVMAAQVRGIEERERSFREEVQKRDGMRDGEMREAFRALSAETLRGSTTEFLKLAEKALAEKTAAGAGELEKKRLEVDQLLTPIRDTLKRTDEKLAAIGTQWAGDRAGLVEHIKGMAAQNEALRGETLKLSRALSKPEVRGRYGEIQLRRVAELAGMAGYCDFCEQASQRDDAGRLLRPDMVVKLPNERTIAVDAKCNTMAYLEAAAATDDAKREECLERFTRHVAEQVGSLSKKGYWRELEGSPDFVVMFVPGDQFLDAALARRGDLLEHAAAANVIIASPTTLIGLLRAVAVGWRENKVQAEVRELRELGAQLHERAATAMEYVAKLGNALGTAVARYNDFVGSYEGKMEPTLRRFEEAGIKGKKELPEVEVVGGLVRGTQRSV